MERIKITLGYWKMVLREAFLSALASADMKRAAIVVLVSFAILVLLQLLSFLGWLPETFRVLVSDFYTEIRINLVYLLFAALIGFIIFIFALVYTPAKIYNKQVARISLLEGNKIIADIRITPFNQPITPKEPNYQQASLCITNNETIELTECIGNMINMRYRDPNGLDEPYSIVLPRHLPWSSRARLGSRHSVTIRPGENQRAILDIAGASKGKMMLNFVEGNEVSTRGEGLYIISVVISGKKNEIPFETSPRDFVLDFRGGESLDIRHETLEVNANEIR